MASETEVVRFGNPASFIVFQAYNRLEIPLAMMFDEDNFAA
jgi:hypothetical protein